MSGSLRRMGDNGKNIYELTKDLQIQRIDYLDFKYEINWIDLYLFNNQYSIDIEIIKLNTNDSMSSCLVIKHTAFR